MMNGKCRCGKVKPYRRAHDCAGCWEALRATKDGKLAIIALDAPRRQGKGALRLGGETKSKGVR